jgi:hypothetical protein
MSFSFISLCSQEFLLTPVNYHKFPLLSPFPPGEFVVFHFLILATDELESRKGASGVFNQMRDGVKLFF